MRNVFVTFLLLSGFRILAQSDLNLSALTQGVARSSFDSIFYEQFKVHRLTDIDKALAFAQLAYTYSRKSGNSTLLVKSSNALGFCFQKFGKLDSSLYYYRKGVQVSLEIKAYERTVFIYNNIGNIFETLAQYDSAIDYYIKSLEYAKLVNSVNDQAIAYNNLGIVYYRIHSSKEALDNFLVAYNIRDLNHIEEGLSGNIVNIAHCYVDKRDFKQAQDFIKIMLALCEKSPCDPETKTDGIHALATAFSEQGKHEEAYLELSKGYPESQTLANTFLKTSYLLSLAKEETYTGRDNSALEHLAFALHVSQKNNMRHLTLVAYHIYSIFYTRKNKFELKAAYLDKYIGLKDSIFSENLTESIKRFAMVEQRRDADRIIISQRDQITVRQNLIIALGAAIAFVVVVTFIFYRKYRFTEKIRSYLKKEIDFQTNVLRGTNEKLVKSLRDYDNFIYKASHDLRGPLATVAGLLEVIRTAKDAREAEEILQMAKNTIVGLDIKLGKLTMINEINQNKPTFEKTSIASVVEEVRKDISRYITYPLVDFGVNGDAVAHFDRRLLHTALLNVLTNSLNHVDHRCTVPYVYVTITDHKKHADIIIEDNGKGIQEDQISSIFNLFSVGYLSNVKPTGVGLYIARLAVERFGGTIELTNNAEPTTFVIRVHKNIIDFDSNFPLVDPL